jgi:SAM-dependent methyltransferase
MNHQTIKQHNIEIQQNLSYWENKPLLQLIYREFYKYINKQVDYMISGKIVELGSGIGNIKMVIPQAICTDLFKNPWIDQIENAYALSFSEGDVSNLILFDVFHHIQYPGNAFKEFHRVLKPGGRVIIFEPSVSMLGILVYGLFHHEPVGLFKKINWNAPDDFNIRTSDYYAAQGNAQRVFYNSKYRNRLNEWTMVHKEKLSAISYVLSGGYSKPQLYSLKWYKSIKKIESLLDYLPCLFSTRLLVVLQKNSLTTEIDK